jgi:hypothetical protein
MKLECLFFAISISGVVCVDCLIQVVGGLDVVFEVLGCRHDQYPHIVHIWKRLRHAIQGEVQYPKLVRFDIANDRERLPVDISSSPRQWPAQSHQVFLVLMFWLRPPCRTDRIREMDFKHVYHLSL